MAEPYFSLLAIGRDTQGIVAAITGVLSENCNVETSQMMTVGGQFAITLIASTEAQLDFDRMKSSLLEAGGESGVRRIHVSELDGFDPAGHPHPTHSVTARVKKDRPGALHEIASVLAHHGVNIISLSSACSVEEPQRCGMSLDISLPDGMRKADVLHLLLESVAKDVEFNVERLRRRF